jgi:hypothetical protein
MLGRIFGVVVVVAGIIAGIVAFIANLATIEDEAVKIFEPAQKPPQRLDVPPKVLQGTPKSVKRDVSLGYLNLRIGPGQDQAVLAKIPAGTRGVYETGACVPPKDHISSYPFCPVDWDGLRGWVSSNGLE